MTLESTPCIQINAPEFFARDDFQEFLNRGIQNNRDHVATWHTGGTPDDGSDVFVTYNNGEGSHAYLEGSDELDDNLIPQDIWDQICEAMERERVSHALLWITNLEE